MSLSIMTFPADVAMATMAELAATRQMGWSGYK